MDMRAFSSSTPISPTFFSGSHTPHRIFLELRNDCGQGRNPGPTGIRALYPLPPLFSQAPLPPHRTFWRLTEPCRGKEMGQQLLTPSDSTSPMLSPPSVEPDLSGHIPLCQPLQNVDWRQVLTQQLAWDSCHPSYASPSAPLSAHTPH